MSKSLIWNRLSTAIRASRWLVSSIFWVASWTGKMHTNTRILFFSCGARATRIKGKEITITECWDAGMHFIKRGLGHWFFKISLFAFRSICTFQLYLKTKCLMSTLWAKNIGSNSCFNSYRPMTMKSGMEVPISNVFQFEKHLLAISLILMN